MPLGGEELLGLIAQRGGQPNFNEGTKHYTVHGCMLMTSPLAPCTEPTTITYGYDPLYHLRGANYTGTLTNTFGYIYKAVGNRLTQNASGAVITYSYDNANRLTSVNWVTYSWDDNGNLLDDGTQTYTYDQANRLKTVASLQLRE